MTARYRGFNIDEQPHLAPSVGFLYERQPPPPGFDQRSKLYQHKPHEKYFWAEDKPIENEGRVLHLGGGMECQVYLKHGTIDGRPITYLAKHWSVHSMMRGFYAEMGLYASSCFLRLLQGTVVPRIIGVYAAPGAVVDVAMEPPHRAGWREADKNISDAAKQKIIDAYKQIHARGVLHGDVELRHMLIGDDGRVTIIDFGLAAVTVDGFEELGLKRTLPSSLDIEMRRVRFLLDFPKGTREMEMALSKKFDREVEQARLEGRRPPEPFEPAIPLRVLEEQWMRSCDDVGRRFAVPATIPVMDGRPRQRNVLIVPRDAATEEEVENLIPYVGPASPDEAASGSDTDTVVDKPAVKQEEGADEETQVVKDEPVEPKIKLEPKDDAVDVKPVVDESPSKKRARSSEAANPPQPEPKRARVDGPPYPPAPRGYNAQGMYDSGHVYDLIAGPYRAANMAAGLVNTPTLQQPRATNVPRPQAAPQPQANPAPAAQPRPNPAAAAPQPRSNPSAATPQPQAAPAPQPQASANPGSSHRHSSRNAYPGSHFVTEPDPAAPATRTVLREVTREEVREMNRERAARGLGPIVVHTTREVKYKPSTHKHAGAHSKPAPAPQAGPSNAPAQARPSHAPAQAGPSHAAPSQAQPRPAQPQPQPGPAQAQAQGVKRPREEDAAAEQLKRARFELAMNMGLRPGMNHPMLNVGIPPRMPMQGARPGMPVMTFMGYGAPPPAGGQPQPAPRAPTPDGLSDLWNSKLAK